MAGGRKPLSPAYARRLERAMARGKTRQEARGHKPREHVERKEREREEYGLTRYENDTIRRWYERSFNPGDRAGKPDEETVIEEARDRGYDWFVQYRHAWEQIRRDYKRTKRRGTYVENSLNILEMAADELDVPDVSWLYYH